MSLDFSDDDFENVDLMEDDDIIILDQDDVEEDENEKLEEECDMDKVNQDEFETKKDDDDDDEDDIDLVEIEEIKTKEKISKKTNITVPFITKYEYPKIISIRSQQIANGSPIFVDVSTLKDKTPMNIAELEFKKGKLNNMIIKRPLPNGTFEMRRISDLKFYDFY